MVAVEHALGGIHMPHCAAVHPARLVRGLAETVERLGVSIYENSPVHETRRGSVITAQGAVSADAVLLATEGYTGTINGHGRQLIPIHSRMVVTEPLTPQQLADIHFDRRYCFGNLDRLVTYGQLTEDKRIAFGCRGSYVYGSGIRTFHPQDRDFDLVRDTLLRFFPALRGIAFTHAWGGCMGVSRSLRPSVVFDRASGTGWAGGYFGNGVGAAHLAGQTLADLVLGHDTDRVHTPWVNPPGKLKRWEPEPLRWLGINARSQLMRLADRAEYRGRHLAPVYHKTLNTVFP
jgi:glycine/D-amino acid oxidase-like deaminating enzyme